MGREIRMVPKSWEHPKNKNGEFKALYEGYRDAEKEFMSMASEEGLQEAIDYMGCPDKMDYMPDWEDLDKTHLMMYETTSEGTPISLAFETPEELSRWLTDSNASAFAGKTATYDQWLSTCKLGWSVSAVIDVDGLKSGVEANHNI